MALGQFGNLYIAKIETRERLGHLHNIHMQERLCIAAEPVRTSQATTLALPLLETQRHGKPSLLRLSDRAMHCLSSSPVRFPTRSSERDFGYTDLFAYNTAPSLLNNPIPSAGIDSFWTCIIHILSSNKTNKTPNLKSDQSNSAPRHAFILLNRRPIIE